MTIQLKNYVKILQDEAKTCFKTDQASARNELIKCTTNDTHMNTQIKNDLALHQDETTTCFKTKQERIRNELIKIQDAFHGHGTHNQELLKKDINAKPATL